MLELGFTGTRKTVTDHGILFRRVGDLGHFLMQTDMYPSCVSLGAFGCTNKLQIAQSSWYRRLQTVTFENLYWIYPVDPLVSFPPDTTNSIPMDEWKYFRYIMSRNASESVSAASSPATNIVSTSESDELRADEWRMAYEECHAAGLHGDYCADTPLWGPVTPSSSASTTSTSCLCSAPTPPSSAGSSSITGGNLPNASTNASSLLSGTNTTTTTVTVTAPVFPSHVEGCLSEYAIKDPYLYLHYTNTNHGPKNKQPKEQILAITPPETCYTGDARPEAKWEKGEINRERAFLQSHKWQRKFFYQWSSDGAEIVSSSDTQVTLDSKVFHFAPVMPLTFKLEFPKTPPDPATALLNQANMLVTHLVGRISVDLEACRRFLRDPYVGEQVDARVSNFALFLVSKNGQIICAKEKMDQVRLTETPPGDTTQHAAAGAPTSGSLAYQQQRSPQKTGARLSIKSIWEVAHEEISSFFSADRWRKLVARLEKASLSRIPRFDVQESAAASSTISRQQTGLGSTTANTYNVDNVGIVYKTASSADEASSSTNTNSDSSGTNTVSRGTHGTVSIAGTYFTLDNAVKNPDAESADEDDASVNAYEALREDIETEQLLPETGEMWVRRISHPRFADFYIVSYMDADSFIDSGASSVFLMLIVLGIAPIFLILLVVALFAIRDQAILMRARGRDKALAEAKETLEAVSAAIGRRKGAGLPQNETDGAQIPDPDS
ncbi:unnamed protein product [Amoebophrya sp. A25]|nr:unnamed protein product [Amoebophrya sp. A25]|eukprot:GSA25T00007264001.1